MVRRNPYEMKKKKTREKEEEVHAFSGMGMQKGKKREKPMLTRCPGLFFLYSKQSI